MGRDKTYISDTGDPDSLELAAIKLLYCRLEIRSSLKLNKAPIKIQPRFLWKGEDNGPLAIPVTAGLGVDDVETGLTSEVFQVLNPGPCKLLSW